MSADKYEVWLEHSFDDEYTMRMIDHGTGQFQTVLVENIGGRLLTYPVTGLVDYERAKVAYAKAVIESDAEELVEDMFESGFEDTTNADDTEDEPDDSQA